MRKNRYNIIQSDLEDAYSSQVKGGNEAGEFCDYIFRQQSNTDNLQTNLTFTVNLMLLRVGVGSLGVVLGRFLFSGYIYH